jgi:hypothetical protein
VTSTAQSAALIDNLTRELVDPAVVAASQLAAEQPEPVAIDLARGSLGVAFLHIEHAYQDPSAWNTVHRWLSHAAADPLRIDYTADPFYGPPALWRLVSAASRPGRYASTLAQLSAATIEITEARLALAHSRIDRAEHPGFAEFDIIRGLTGLGAYHLRAHPDHEITAAVLRYLVRLTEPLPGSPLPGWWVDHGPQQQAAADYPGGHGNLGLAHGISGPLALLALSLRKGITVTDHTIAIQRICTWLDHWQQHDEHGTWWPRAVTINDVRKDTTSQTTPTTASWCYGTPGIARAQQLAGIACRDRARQQRAERAMLDCLTDATQLDQIVDPGLCHGAAGLLHTTWHMARDATGHDLATELPALTVRLIDYLRGGWWPPYFFTGTPGAVLALRTVVSNQPPQSNWDTIMLLC